MIYITSILVLLVLLVHLYFYYIYYIYICLYTCILMVLAFFTYTRTAYTRTAYTHTAYTVLGLHYVFALIINIVTCYITK